MFKQQKIHFGTKMNLEFIMLCFFILIGNLVFGQNSNTILPSENTITITSNIECIISEDKQDSLMGNKLSFNVKLKNLKVDTINNGIVVFAKFKKSDGYKEILYFSFDRDSILWKYRSLSQDCFFNSKNTILNFTDGFDYYYTKNFFISNQTGKPGSWREYSQLYYDFDRDVYLTLNGNTTKRKFEVFDNDLFKKYCSIDVPNKSYLANYEFRDSLLFVNLDRLIVFDKNFSKLWEYDISTKKLDSKSILISSGLSFGIGLSTGFVPIGIPNYLLRLTSNFFVDGNSVFITDKDFVYNFNLSSGEINWKLKINGKLGYSELFSLNDSTLVCVNTALSEKNGFAHKYGEPTIILIDKKSGKETAYFEYSKSKYVTDIKSGQEKITQILLDDRLVFIDENGTIIQFEGNKPDSIGDYVMFYDNSIIEINYFDSTSGLWMDLEAIKSESKDKIVVADNGIAILDKVIEVNKFLKFDEIGVVVYETTKYKYFEKYQVKKEKIKFEGIIKYDKKTRKNYSYKIIPFELKNGLMYIRTDNDLLVIELD